MAKIQIVRVDYHTEKDRGALWVAHIAAFSVEEGVKTISNLLKKDIIPTSLSVVCELDAFSKEAQEYFINSIAKESKTTAKEGKEPSKKEKIVFKTLENE